MVSSGRQTSPTAKRGSTSYLAFALPHLEDPMSTPFAPPQSIPDVPAPVVVADRTVVPLIEESVVVQTRRVDQGGYRVTKTVNVHDEVVDEPLTFQTVDVERRAIGKLLASMDVPMPRQEGNTWVLPVVEEVLVTEKRLLLKEEIRITRTESVHRQAQRVSLRSEEVSIDRLDPGSAPGIGAL